MINNNDILRRVRYIFDFNDQTMLSLFKLGGYDASQEEFVNWLRREGEVGFVLCEDENLACFLNGLIIKNRGSRGSGVPKPEPVLNNNIILRKLKIALNLDADELRELLELNNFIVSKHELSAFFRRPNHKNYRECLDQLLRNLLDGMEKYYRKNNVWAQKKYTSKARRNDKNV